MTEKTTPDWERIEQLYRAGLLSLREIAIACPGANHVAIARRAKKFGWVQDLSAKIKAKAEDIVTRQAVTESETAERAVTDLAVIDANAQAIANVRLAHRTDIRRSRRLANKLLDELDCLTDNRDLFEQLGELLHEPDDKGIDRRNDLYSKVISLPGRSKTMKELSDTLKTLVTLERQAYDLESAPEDETIGKITRIIVKPQ
ncbi:hypothetical protein KVG88_06370 [Pseudomonas sp. SWRI74]|uniref:Phage protein n=1 Tax=Pseudomonas azerbaijanoccidentalis TaxID=2842347 RepID=A0ABS6QL51_9PSED|nr:hypothetical protein [Pseudomonas azerbaijanoccidentalis]MBV4519682.1 hypothetical protein [Pseudomonas azerbaijanoccidentalis]